MINHLFQLQLWKHLLGQSLKKVTTQTGLIQRQVLVINGSETSKKGKTLLTGNMVT